MLMYHCDGKGCDFASTNRDDFVHIKIGDPTNNELFAQIAARDLCPVCANRLALILGNELVAPVDTDAIIKEQIKEPCFGACDNCAGEYEDDYTEKTIKALKECGEKVASKLRATQQLAASVVGERMLNYLMRHSENGTRKIKYHDHMNNWTMAKLVHDYATGDIRDICKKYSVTATLLKNPSHAFAELYSQFKSDIVNAYKEGFNADDIAIDIGVSDSCIGNLLRRNCPEEFWRRDIYPDAPSYDHTRDLDVDLVISMYDSGATILAIQDFTGYSVADIVSIMNSNM